MNSSRSASRLTTSLRITAASAALAVLILWIGTGAHRGWTQTSTVTIQRDEITGIDFPVRHDAFVAGIEILAAGFGFAALLAGASLFTHRRNRAARA